jgi:hypothetical protein
VKKLESILVSFFRNIYPFITKIDVYKDINTEEVEYVLTLFCDGKRLQSFLPISPNFIDGTGKLKKDLLDRPFNHFVSITDNNQSNIGRAKTLETNLKKDFYLVRRMAGSDFKSGLVKLRIVLQ